MERPPVSIRAACQTPAKVVLHSWRMTQNIQSAELGERPRNAVANAFAAFQVMVFRRPKLPITGRPRDVTTALLILFLGSVAAHRSYFSGSVEFSLWGFETWLAELAVLYLAITVLTILVHREEGIGPIFVVAAMAILTGLASNTFIFHLLGERLSQNTSYSLYMALGSAPMITAMLTLTMSPRACGWWRGLVIGLGSVALASLATMYFGPAYLFQETYDDDDGTPQAELNLPDPEVLYPLQAELLGAEIDALAAHTPGRTDIYAVLGAGSPRQQIFQREVDEMERTLTARFRADGKVIALGSTVEDHTARPLLNRTNLAASLRAAAEKMDVSEDIALIFLTAHGSPEELATYFPGLGSRDLTSAEVATALDESGIRNAIIIVSACYSGSFVDDLEGPARLVLTAAAADRSSFGCSDSNTFTDWGTAFFATALQEVADFRVAAQRASEIVHEQEIARGLTPSLPQISEGEEIGAVIERFISEEMASN